MSEGLKAEAGRSTAGFTLAGRSGWQMLVSYGIGSWIVLQVAEVLSSLIGLPLWFGRTLLALLAVGLLLLVLSMAIQAGRSGPAVEASAARPVVRSRITARNIALAFITSLVLFVLGTAAHLTLRSSGIGPFGTLMAKGVLDDQDRLILADFDSRAADPGLGATVTTLFRIDLAQSPSFAVLEPSQLRPVLDRMQRDAGQTLNAEVALEAARREGVKAIVTGEVLPVGDALVIAARVVAVSTGETLAAVRETAGSATDLPKAVDRASARLRERIGESLRTIQGDPPLERVTTRSLPALEKYALADRANDAGESDRALELLEQAIADDSTFAMAHRKLAIILRNENRDRDRASTAFARAWELRDHLSDRERWLAEAAYLDYVQGDRAGATSVYRILLEKYPNDGIALNNLAVDYIQMGMGEEALALLMQGIDAGAAPAASYGNAIETAFGLGRFAAADSTLARFAEAYPGNAQLDRIASYLASAQFDYDAAELHLRRLTESQAANPALLVASLAQLSMMHGIRGRIDEARQALREAALADQRAGTDFLGLTPELAAARIDAPVTLLFLGDPEKAVAIADSVFTPALVDRLPSEQRPYADLISFYAQSARVDRAREWLVRFEAARPGPERDGLADWHFALGEVALAERRTDDALGSFTAARELASDCSICFLYEIGRTFEAAGRPDSAITAYTRYLEERYLYRVNSDTWNLARVLLRLAELHEQAGRPREAIRYYARFLDLWSDADPALRGTVESARRSMARLNERIG